MATKLFRVFNQFKETVHKTFLKVLNVIVVHIFYFFGIGGTSLVAKLFGKTFIVTEYKSSSWRDAAQKVRLNRQF